MYVCRGNRTRVKTAFNGYLSAIARVTDNKYKLIASYKWSEIE